MIRGIFVIVLIANIFAVNSGESNTCVTPYKENATCVPLLTCNVIATALTTFTPQAFQFAKDSQCGCDMGMVCCGAFYNQTYPPLVNCSPSPQLETSNTSSAKASPEELPKEIKKDLLKGKSCVTPYGENATCVSLSKCDVLLSALDTQGDRGHRLWKDSKCNCDAEMVCCGTYNNKRYTPLVNCAPSAQPEKIFLSSISDESLCGLDSSTDRIKGGSTVKFEELPWVAALEYQFRSTKKNAGFRCGGSIITERFVLTAAHCILNDEFMISKVWLGVTNITLEKYCPIINGNVECINTVQKINVEYTVPHEFYNSIDKLHDIGLLRLKNDIEISKYVRPICIPSSDSELPRLESYLTVAGWGTTENGKSSEIKLKVEVPLKDNNVCNEFLKTIDRKITSQQLCVGGERGKDSCQGDSGGPLMYELVGVNHDVQWYQQGIVSYGTGCGVEGRPGIYVKVSSYITWIVNKINNVNYFVGKDEPCRTPNGTIGTCVPLSTCEEVTKAASTKNPHGFYYTIKSRCDYDDLDEVLVCCQNPNSIIIPNVNSTALPDKTMCGILKNEPRINGTEIKDLAEYPWVVGIEFSRENFNINEIRCIGTVLNSRYVLTSADCLRSKSVPVNVWLGHWNTSAYNDCKKINNTVNCTSPVQKIKIKKTIEHPFFFLYQEVYDIALVFLKNEIKFSDYIRPICLPLENLPKLETGTRMTVLKWPEGATTEFITSSDMMLKEEIPLVSNDKCYIELYGVNSLQMCAGNEDNQSCNRIIGAPLMRSYEEKPNGRTQWYLEGLVNFISDEYLEEFEVHPGTYTRVSSYLYWIVNIISEN